MPMLKNIKLMHNSIFAQQNQKHMLNLFVFLFTLFISCFCHALSTDKQQPAYIKSDSAVLNHKTKICIYIGHVELIQGSTTITADTLTTYSDAENQLEKTTAVGKVATYSTLPDNTPQKLVATALTINYYPKKAEVELIGDAKATQGSDSFAGPRINYDIKQQIITSPASKEGRTTIIIQPGQKIGLPK